MYVHALVSYNWSSKLKWSICITVIILWSLVQNQNIKKSHLYFSRDTLRIREAKIFAAVLRWSEAECIRRQLAVTPSNQRMVLGRAFNAIRFPLMSVEEFAMGPAQSGLLDDREIVQLFLYFTVNPKPNVGFLDTPRCCMTGKELTVNRFPQTESRWGYSGTTDRIRFTVDQRIFVVGFGLYGSYFGPTEYEVHLQVSNKLFILLFDNCFVCLVTESTTDRLGSWVQS